MNDVTSISAHLDAMEDRVRGLARAERAAQQIGDALYPMVEQPYAMNHGRQLVASDWYGERQRLAEEAHGIVKATGDLLAPVMLGTCADVEGAVHDALNELTRALIRLDKLCE